MKRILGFLLVLGVGGLNPSCSCSDDGNGVRGPGPCEGDTPADSCGAPCGDGTSCPAFFYCGSDDTCTADCSPVTGSGCTNNERCTNEGRCERVARDGRTPDNVCASVQVGATPVTPTVLLIVDQSGSMNEDFGSGTRWTVLRDSLLDPDDGLIADLEGVVRFGLSLYSARAPGNDKLPEGECPILTEVAPKLDNYADIQATYGPADVIDETPTGDAIDKILDGLANLPDPGDDPVIFILATDGEPDRCEELNPNPTDDAQREAIEATQRAFTSGIRTFVITDEHLQALANAGLGRDPEEMANPAEFWEAGDDQDLKDTLSEIVGGQLSCTVELNGRVDPDMACSGEVRLNGELLPCDEPNGWRAVDESHIELLDDACDTLKSGNGAVLEAEFPCNAILI